MRRVHRMRHEAARPARLRFSVNRLATIADVDDARIVSARGQRVEFGKIAPGFHRLGTILLEHIRCAIQRVGHALRGPHPRGRPFRVAYEAMLGEFIEPLGDQRQRLVGRAIARRRTSRRPIRRARTPWPMRGR